MADRLRLEQVAKTTPAQIVSSATQLQLDPYVSGQGAPTHTPDRPTQQYVDNDTGYLYQYWAGTWSHT